VQVARCWTKNGSFMHEDSLGSAYWNRRVCLVCQVGKSACFCLNFSAGICLNSGNGLLSQYSDSAGGWVSLYSDSASGWVSQYSDYANGWVTKSA
jgi:hypothetical protein